MLPKCEDEVFCPYSERVGISDRFGLFSFVSIKMSVIPEDPVQKCLSFNDHQLLMSFD